MSLSCIGSLYAIRPFSFQNIVMTSELLDDHQDTLKDKEGMITELRQKVKELSSAREAATEKINRLQEDLTMR